MKKFFLNGYEVATKACIEAGAEFMYGYPITPSSDILNEWIKQAQKNKKLQYLQTEDEIAAGFALCGSVIAGKKSFTATSGPGNVLMQDALSMAEGMRLPFVAIIAQRGGPSSGTVIYSQQEVNLTVHGGNGEGLRIVYSPSDLKELYRFIRYAFNVAWKYRFPAIVLTDGYLLKTKQDFEIVNQFRNEKAFPLFTEKKQKNIRNIYTAEEELAEKLFSDKEDFVLLAKEISESDSFELEKADYAIIAHGIVAAVAYESIKDLRKKGIKIGLFKPCTLSPFPVQDLNEKMNKIKKIFIVESSLGQLADLIKQNLNFLPEIVVLQKPALGIEKTEIEEFVKNNI
ncbi:MAG: ferredoxin oxidoreductase [Patescibacteria group bacterium]